MDNARQGKERKENENYKRSKQHGNNYQNNY